MATRLVSELNPHSAINIFENNLSSLPSISSHQSLNPYHQHLDFDNIDIQQISALISPIQTNKDCIEDQEMDQHSISTYPTTYPPYQPQSTSNSRSDDENSMSPLQILRGSRQKPLDTSMNSSSIQNQYLPSPPYSSFNEMVSLDSIYGQQLQQQQQPQQHIQFHDQQLQNGQLLTSVTQSQAYCSTNSTMYPTPSIASFGSMDSTITLQPNCATPSYNYYIAPFEQISQQQQLQQFQPLDSAFQHSATQSDIQSLEQNMDILAMPQLDGGTYNAELTMLLSSTTGSVAESPTMSWDSFSRDVSPEFTPASSAPKREFTKTSKRKASGIYSRSMSMTIRARAEISGNADSSAALATDLSATSSATDLPSKRKRRVRQLKIKVKQTKFVCDSPGCGKEFSRAYNLTSHMKTHSSEKPFGCGSCELAFARRHDRERHVRIHTGEKPYSCDSCGLGFMRNDALHRHQRLCGQSSPAPIALMQSVSM
ncbi:hypothetical protein BGZ76_004085 [Entomortierella beljakovae]|nr:hypothetical protein BGZ76_004085 [Entomortierella beljakovae]